VGARPLSAVADVGASSTGRVALVIAEVLSQLDLQATFQNGLDHRRDEAALTGQLELSSVDLVEQQVQEITIHQLLNGRSRRLARRYLRCRRVPSSLKRR